LAERLSLNFGILKPGGLYAGSGSIYLAVPPIRRGDGIGGIITNPLLLWDLE